MTKLFGSFHCPVRFRGCQAEETAWDYDGNCVNKCKIMYSLFCCDCLASTLVTFERLNRVRSFFTCIAKNVISNPEISTATPE